MCILVRDDGTHTHTRKHIHTATGLASIVWRCWTSGLPSTHRRGSSTGLALKACGCMFLDVTQVHCSDVHMRWMIMRVCVCVPSQAKGRPCPTHSATHSFKSSDFV